ncbi:MAG: hypothetical protein AAGA20_01855 [Planctomycetota bacterium]
MYLATVEIATRCPSSVSSSLMRGALHMTFSIDIRRIYMMIAMGVGGRLA